MDLMKHGIYKASLRRKDGWDFDWYEPINQNFKVFALFIENEPLVIQGLIA